MFWKIYFYFFIAVNLVMYPAFLFIDEAAFMFEIKTISDVVGAVTAPIGILGLYGLVKDKKLFFQKFWIGFFFVLMLNEIFYGSNSFLGVASEYEMSLQFFLLMAGAFLLFLPYYVGIYFYATKKDFWYEKHT